jgi:hypothetical protein
MRISRLLKTVLTATIILPATLSGQERQFENIEAAKLPPWPKMVVMEGDLPVGYLKTRTHIVEPDGDLRGLPYKATAGTLVDATEGSIASSIFESTGYVGSVQCSNGRQIAFPAYAKRGYAVFELDGTWKHRGLGWQLRGGAEHASGRVYSIPFTPNASRVHWIDSNTLKYGSFSNPRKGTANKHTWGAVGANGHVFFLPFDLPYVEMIHRDDLEKVTRLDTIVTGGRNSRSKFTHGVYHRASKKVVSLSRRATTTILIDADDFAIEEVAMPKELRALYPSGTFSFGCETGPDGWVYSSPWAHSIVYRFNPVSQQYDWRDFSEQLNHEDVLPKAGHLGNGYCTVMTSMKNPKGRFEIFYGTGGISKGIKLVFPNPN